MPGSYDQYCPIARGLDVIGDRWTLLVLRELSLGSQRFTDLRRHLPGIPPNVLSQRLKRLTDDGMVALEELPPPAARSVYTLTPRGREVQPVLRALVRFGTPELAPASPERAPRADTVAPLVFLSWFDEGEAARVDVDEHYDVVVDGLVQHLSSRRAAARRRVEEAAAVTVAGPAWAFSRLRQGRTLDELATDGSLQVTGSQAARTRFRRVYALA
ncbi:MAG TPA: helix-turn-helix domain-containing protein [Acidimicrobiales bacterium]|nr:helix-turn-helix domain-containing protein [Acidimicrobiales bacterium]